MFQLFHCYIFLAWQIIVFWLLRGYLSKSNFDVCQVAFKGNRRLYWWNPVRFYLERMFSLVVTVKYVLETHSSCKLFEIGQHMGFDFIYNSIGSRDKLKLFWQYTYLTISRSERFLRNFSFVSLSLLHLFCLAVFLRLTCLPFFDNLATDIVLAVFVVICSEITLL